MESITLIYHIHKHAYHVCLYAILLEVRYLSTQICHQWLWGCQISHGLSLGQDIGFLHIILHSIHFNMYHSLLLPPSHLWLKQPRLILFIHLLRISDYFSSLATFASTSHSQSISFCIPACISSWILSLLHPSLTWTIHLLQHPILFLIHLHQLLSLLLILGLLHPNLTWPVHPAASQHVSHPCLSASQPASHPKSPAFSSLQP